MKRNVKNGSVKIGDTDMYYVSFGKGERNLVILPGLSDGLATVKRKGLILSMPYKKFFDDYTVYMFSRKNSMPEGYSIRDMAHDQVLALKEIGIEKTILMGVSQGGMISQYITIDYPELIEGLILAETAPYANPTVLEGVNLWIDMAKKDDHKSLMIDTVERMYSEKYLKKNRKMIPITAALTKPKDYERFLRNAYAILDFDAREELSKINCPVFILSGDDDNTVGNDAPHEFKKAIKDSEMFIYHGYGHGCHEECKDFYDKVFEFCESIKIY